MGNVEHEIQEKLKKYQINRPFNKENKTVNANEIFKVDLNFVRNTIKDLGYQFTYPNQKVIEDFVAKTKNIKKASTNTDINKTKTKLEIQEGTEIFNLKKQIEILTKESKKTEEQGVVIAQLENEKKQLIEATKAKDLAKETEINQLKDKHLLLESLINQQQKELSHKDLKLSEIEGYKKTIQEQSEKITNLESTNKSLLKTEESVELIQLRTQIEVLTEETKKIEEQEKVINQLKNERKQLTETIFENLINQQSMELSDKGFNLSEIAEYKRIIKEQSEKTTNLVSKHKLLIEKYKALFAESERLKDEKKKILAKKDVEKELIKKLQQEKLNLEEKLKMEKLIRTQEQDKLRTVQEKAKAIAMKYAKLQEDQLVEVKTKDVARLKEQPSIEKENELQLETSKQVMLQQKAKAEEVIRLKEFIRLDEERRAKQIAEIQRHSYPVDDIEEDLSFIESFRRSHEISDGEEKSNFQLLLWAIGYIFFFFTLMVALNAVVRTFFISNF